MKPVLFLDFDRTLFDTDQFYDWLGEDRFQRILDVTAGHVAPPDFADYLYDDTVSFLKVARRTHRVVLLTYALNTLLQRKKIRGSGIIPLIDDVLITHGGDDNKTGKGESARDYISRVGDSGWEHVFVDDSSENVDEVKRENPEMRCIRIDRTPPRSTKEGLLSPDAVVRNLAELEAVL